MNKKIALIVSMAGIASMLLASDPKKDWPMWGGSNDRNMLSAMKGAPTTWDIAKKTNVKWMSALGSQTYGNPVVSDGVVLVGTNNEGLRVPAEGGDRGVVMAFDEKTGAFLWQISHEKIASGRVNDWPYQGVCSSQAVENGIVYYVSNRGEIVAAGLKDGKIIWKFDMIEEVGSFPHNMSNSSPAIYGDLIFVSTSNGQDESHVNIPSPKAPSIIAVNKKTGKLVWEANQVGEKILHGQWSSPAVAKIGDVVQVIIGQGDGKTRSYVAETGKLLWEFDLNPKESVWPKTRNEVIATPIIVGDVVYLANGQDPEHGEGVGHLYAIDATKRGDITQTGRLWHYDKIRRSISTGAYYNGLLFYSDFSGFLHCLDAKTGKPYWTHDMLAAVWGSPMVIDGKVYLGDEDGDVVVLEASKEKKLIAESSLGSSVYATPVPANGAIFIANRNQLWALEVKK